MDLRIGTERFLFDQMRDDEFSSLPSFGEDLMDKIPVEDYEIEKPRAISTLQCGSLLPLRHCGNTTRQIDWAIQQLYNGKVVQLKDHHLGGTHLEANDNMWKEVMKRLPIYDKGKVVTNYIDQKFRQICFKEDFLKEIERRRIRV